MTTEIWARIRRLFVERRPSRELDHVLADWRVEERAGKSAPAAERERLHPLKGWIKEGSERAPDEVNLAGRVRRSAHDRTQGR